MYLIFSKLKGVKCSSLNLADMEKKLLYIFVMVLFITSCSQDANPGRENMFKNKTFVHLYFDSEEECLAAQPHPDFWTNCHQEIIFHDRKEVTIMLTDILWKGNYKIKGDLLILNFENNPEVPTGEINFKIINPTKLIRLDDNTLWKKLSGYSVWK